MTASGQVLVVDDEPAIQRLVSALFKTEGYEVRTARNGQEALDLLQDWQPDLIVLDLMMPVMDGRTFRAVQLQLDPATTIPLIVLTAHRTDQGAADGLGAAAVLTKPFEIDELLEAVDRSLRSHDGGGLTEVHRSTANEPPLT